MTDYIAKYSGIAMHDGSGYSRGRSAHVVNVHNEQRFTTSSDNGAGKFAKGVVKDRAAKKLGLPDSSGLKLESLVRVIPISDD